MEKEEKKEEKGLIRKPALELINKGSIVIDTVPQLIEWCAIIHISGLAPAHLKTPEALFAAANLGMDLGLSAMTSIQNIAVINGIASVFGDIVKAIVVASGKAEYIIDSFEGTPYKDDYTAICRTKKIGNQEYIYTFSVEDAKRAGLWGKAGTWTKYPKRMLMFRARNFALRDEYSEILKGVKLAEEVADYEIISSEKPKKGLSGMMSSMEAPPED
jgi:hypothetical protein